MFKRLVVIAAVLVPLALPAVASAHGSRGVVVKVDRAARMVAVSRAHARVALVHTARAPRLRAGERVRMETRRLGDGTLAASSIAVVGEASSVAVRGTVVSIAGNLVTVSAGGATLTFRDDQTAKLVVGNEVMLRLKFDEGRIEVEDVELVQPAMQGVSIKGHLTIGAGTITVSDHDASVTGTVPSGFDLGAFRTGDEVLATFAIEPNGSLVLTRLSREDVNEDEQDQANAGDDNDHVGANDRAGDDHGGDGGHDGGSHDGGGGHGGGGDGGS